MLTTEEEALLERLLVKKYSTRKNAFTRHDDYNMVTRELPTRLYPSWTTHGPTYTTSQPCEIAYPDFTLNSAWTQE